MIWGSILCVAGAAATVFLAPTVLTVGRWQLLHPRLALGAWFGSFFLGAGLVTLGLLVSLAGAIITPPAATGAESLALTGAAWIGLGLLGAAATFVAAAAEPLAQRQRAALAALAPTAVSREARRGFTLVRFDAAEALAYAMPGRAPEIFVSSAMESLLPPAQLEAVLAHEYAHLRHRHGGAMRIAQVNALCLPRLRSGRALQRATTLLVELAADDAAARQAGAAHLANALSALAHHTGNAGMALRAERLASKRWPRASRRRLPRAMREAAASSPRPRIAERPRGA